MKILPATIPCLALAFSSFAAEEPPKLDFRGPLFGDLLGPEPARQRGGDRLEPAEPLGGELGQGEQALGIGARLTGAGVIRSGRCPPDVPGSLPIDIHLRPLTSDAPCDCDA